MKKDAKCDICGIVPDVIFDVSVSRGPHAGRWANLCPKHNDEIGRPLPLLGTGIGQQYDNKTGEKLAG